MDITIKAQGANATHSTPFQHLPPGWGFITEDGRAYVRVTASDGSKAAIEIDPHGVPGISIVAWDEVKDHIVTQQAHFVRLTVEAVLL